MGEMARSKAQIERLIQGALGEVKADLIIKNGRLVNVYSGEILDRCELSVLDGRICYVGPTADHTRGEGTQILDARSLYVAPGFIDGHTHIGHFCRPYEHLQAYVPCGTTAVMASFDEFATVFGFAGFEFFIRETERHPVRVYPLLSMCAPQDPLLCHTRSFTQAEVEAALDDPRVLGLGEIVSWLRLIQRDPELLERVEMAWQRRKIIHGHTAGARDAKLCAIAAAGVSSCHEPVTADDAVERLRLGYWLMLREGSLRQDLAATLRPIVRQGLNTQRLILVTDSLYADDASGGHMDEVLRRAIRLGLKAFQAIQAVTLNPAVYSGLDQDLGGLAPGRFGDFVLFDNMEKPQVESTFIGGKLVAEAGRSLVASAAQPLPPELCGARPSRSRVRAEQFRIASPLPEVKIRAMELVNATITAESLVSVRARTGFLEADPERDLLKVAAIDRHEGTGRVALGFLKGFGARLGAVGTTANLDENTLLLIGSSDRDMALCANMLLESGGGVAIVDQGQVIEKLAMPFGGVFSPAPWREVGDSLQRIHRLLREKGSPFPKPLYTLYFLTFVTLPALRITDRGLVRVKERRFVPLVVEEAGQHQH
jgi:adenine deaminase